MPPAGQKLKNQKKREKAKLKKLEKSGKDGNVRTENSQPKEPEVVIEYVEPTIDDPSIPAEYRDIFEHFLPVKVEAENEAEMKGFESKDNNSEEDDEDFMESDDEQESHEKSSKRKLKKMNRPSVALLNSLRSIQSL